MTSVWHLLDIDSMAIDAGFGLEYYMIGDKDEAKPLLKRGVEFCDMIQKGNLATTKEKINSSDLDAWEDVQVIVKSNTPEEFKTIVEKAELVRADLMKIIEEGAVYPEEEIRNMQQFFNDTSRPYLRKAHNLVRRRCKW